MRGGSTAGGWFTFRSVAKIKPACLGCEMGDDDEEEDEEDDDKEERNDCTPGLSNATSFFDSSDSSTEDRPSALMDDDGRLIPSARGARCNK